MSALEEPAITVPLIQQPRLVGRLWRELAVLLPMVFFIVWIGVYSKPFLSKMDASVENLVRISEQGLQRERPVSEEDRQSVYELLTGEQKARRQ